MSLRVSNTLKTFGLFALMWALLMFVGGLISAGTKSSVWLWIFAGIGLVTTFTTYWNSASLALKQMKAYPVTAEQAPELHRIVRELAEAANMPTPTVWVAPTHSPNAFATGRNPSNAAVCVTEGILQILDERQLRGVLAHELMHVYNRDILTASVASAMAGLITSVAQFALMFGGGQNRDNRGGGFGAVIAALAAPFIAQIVQLGISRTREYDADEDGALLTGDPMALADALQKINGVSMRTPMARTPDTENVSAMMIANPFKGLKVSRLFSTHPPMADRVERLENMERQMRGGS